MPWKVGMGSKFQQLARVPLWIQKSKTYSRHCLKGLLQTDGSIYRDRGYLMVNFTNHTQPLVEDVFHILETLGFRPTVSKTATKNGGLKYCVRLARNAETLIQKVGLSKS